MTGDGDRGEGQGEPRGKGKLDLVLEDRREAIGKLLGLTLHLRNGCLHPGSTICLS